MMVMVVTMRASVTLMVSLQRSNFLEAPEDPKDKDYADADDSIAVADMSFLQQLRTFEFLTLSAFCIVHLPKVWGTFPTRHAFPHTSCFCSHSRTKILFLEQKHVLIRI